MLISGALAGLVGCSQVLGSRFKLTPDIDDGLGFDAITVALLGRGSPLAARCSPDCSSAPSAPAA